jgi:hypothetical protein
VVLDTITDPKMRRRLLRALIAQQEAAIPPMHHQALDPVAVLIPRSLFKDLREALAALDVGEVLPFVERTATQSQAAWTWNQARSRAVEHVHFLVGYGWQLKDARPEVGSSMGVSADTLRDWERTLRSIDDDRYSLDLPLPSRIKIARGAGKLGARLEGDPEFGSRDGETIGADEMAMFDALRIEPLDAFAKRYQREFGQRHHIST